MQYDSPEEDDEMIEVDISPQFSKIQRISFKAQKKTVWDIEIMLDTKYNIERSFSQFEWLLTELRKNDSDFLLPSIGSKSIETYIKTKLFISQKQLTLRTHNLSRFLNKIQKKNEIYNSKAFQVFICRQHFNLYRKKYQEQIQNNRNNFLAQAGQRFWKLVGPQNPISIAYKQKFKDLREQLDPVISSFSQIFEAHKEYLDVLAQFQPKLKEQDQKYSNQLYQLLNSLYLIRDQIHQNQQEAAKERNSEMNDFFKKHFEGKLKQYKTQIRGEIRNICERLGKVNEQSSKKISFLFRNHFKIQI